MKWKYYGTTDNVFWDAASTDKPSREYIESMNWEEINIDLHHVSPYLARTQCETDQYNLIRAENVVTKKVLFWMLKNIVMYTEQSYNLEYELDTWTTYNLKMLEQDVSVLADRHQDYDDDRCLEFDDNVFKNDLPYDNFNFLKKSFKNGDKYESNNALSNIKPLKSTINSNFCLVLNDVYQSTSANEFYTFIPIISRLPNSFIVNSLPKDVQHFYNDGFIYNVQSGGGFRVNAFFGNKATLRYSIPNGKENYFEKFYKWYYNYVSLDYRVTLYLSLSSIKPNGAVEATQTYDINEWVDQLDDYFGIDVFDGGELYINNSRTGKSKTYKWGRWNTTLLFTVKVQDRRYIDNNSKLCNNWLDISNLSKTLSNKIVGIYITPNILNMDSTWDIRKIDNKDFLVYKIVNQGNSISSIDFDLPYPINNKLEFNNDEFFHKILYKGIEANFLNNIIDCSKLIEQDKIVIADKIFFTNSFSLMRDNNKIALDKNVLTLPNQQPYFIDTYKQYIQANMNSVNTGYEIQKQQTIFNSVNTGINSIMGAIGSGVSGNAMGVIDSLKSGATGIAGNVLGLQNYEKQLRAKYADAESTMGNNLLFSSTRDMLFSNELVKYDDQYDLLYYKHLGSDTIKQLNNYFLLNGVYNPKYFSLKDLPKPTKHLGFYYAKLNTTNFNQIFSSYINESREIKDVILKNLEEFRVWDRVPSIE